MSLWVRLPEGLDSEELLSRAQREGVTYLPGRQFAVSRPEPRGLRISFGGLSPDQIERGIAKLGEIFREEQTRKRRGYVFDNAPALV
jgi:2-aminoadipate transaminase